MSRALLLPLLLALPAAAQNPAAMFDAYTEKGLRDWHVPGLAVSVIKDGRVVFARGYGVRELGKPGIVDTSTLFAAASTTKAMTAAALALLVDEGKLRWDDPVIKHLPGFQLADPFVTREVTVRDLLTHRAGLGNADFLWYKSGLSRDDVLQRVRWVRPAYSFRAGYIYHNVMYAVAGQVVATVSGKSWDEFLRQRFFAPLGMTRTVATLAEATTRSNVAAPHHAWGATFDSVTVIANAAVDPAAPAGSIWTSVADWSKWLAFLIDSGRVNGRQLLKPATFAELLKPVTIIPQPNFFPTSRITKPNWTSYGLGWFQQDYRGRKLDYHTGSIDGMVAIALIIPNERFGVYVLSNLNNSNLRHALMFKAIDLWLGTPKEAERDWSAEFLALYKGLALTGDSTTRAADARRTTGTRPSLPIEKYAGTYSDSLFGQVMISMANGGLRLQRGERLATLEHWEYDIFRARWDDRWTGSSTVTFTIGAGGVARALDIDGGRMVRMQ